MYYNTESIDKDFKSYKIPKAYAEHELPNNQEIMRRKSHFRP